MNRYVFDDGSLASKVLQYEVKDVEVIKVKPYIKLDQWLSDSGILEENDKQVFIFLHFTTGDLIRTDVDIRADVAAAIHNYPNLRIILQYQQMDNPGIERRALNYGISLPMDSDPVKKIIEENKEKFHFVEYADYKGEGFKKELNPNAGYNSEDSFNIKNVNKEELGKNIPVSDMKFDKAREEFKDKRRRKKNENTKN